MSKANKREIRLDIIAEQCELVVDALRARDYHDLADMFEAALEPTRDTAPPDSPERAAELAQDDADTLAVAGEESP